ncbi:MAG: four helix bundle protein [Bacteroidetes bacterium]|nr:four helix bundle protein [Bacteroidota bacterium]
MFLELAHTRLNVYHSSQDLVLECYKITRNFPNDEKFAMAQQIRRAALSVYLNISEGCSRKSQAERKRFFEIARGSVIEVDTAIEVASKLSYVSIEQLQPLGKMIINTFKMLSGLMISNASHS